MIRSPTFRLGYNLEQPQTQPSISTCASYWDHSAIKPLAAQSTILAFQHRESIADGQSLNITSETALLSPPKLPRQPTPGGLLQAGCSLEILPAPDPTICRSKRGSHGNRRRRHASGMTRKPQQQQGDRSGLLGPIICRDDPFEPLFCKQPSRLCFNPSVQECRRAGVERL